MPSLPGLNADVYFGDAEQPLPDWRAEVELDTAEEPEDELDAEHLAAVRSLLGFDPDELSEPEQPTVNPINKPSPFKNS